MPGHTRFPTVLLALTMSLSTSFAAKPDRWKGLVLNESTPKQAIEALGAPKRDETGELLKLIRGGMLNGSNLLRARKADLVRVLKYESPGDFKSVSLVFKEDKLALIQLVPDKQNKIAARDLKDLYEDTVFRTVFEDHDFWTQAYGVDQATGSVRPKNYPVVYYLVGVSPILLNSVVVGTIENQPGLAGMLGAADATLPGKVFMLDLVSTSMLPPKPKNKSLD